MPWQLHARSSVRQGCVRAQIPEQGPRRYRQLRVAEDPLAFDRATPLAVKAMLVDAIAYFVWPAGTRCW